MAFVDSPAPRELQHVNIIEDASRRKQGFPDYFRIGKLLGKGGFAKCYEAVDSKTGLVYAAKIVFKASVVKPRALAKLRSEIAIHRSLNHEKVVKFYDYFEDSEKVYILLELCPNQTLNEYMRNRPHKRLSEPEAIFFLYDLIMGLKYLHGRRIIHRDLKLGNLFLDADTRIKIGDFGLATKLEYDGEKKRTICGTPNYIAPEILEGRQGHSYEVDIWSLGVIMYTMLFGRPPFETQDVKATYRKIRYNQYTFPEQIPVSEAAKELIGTILRTDPNERPSLDSILATSWLRSPYGFPPVVPTAARTMIAASPRTDSTRPGSETPERGDFPDFARIDSPAPAFLTGRNQSPCAFSARVTAASTPVRATVVAGAEANGYITPGRHPSATTMARPPLGHRGTEENGVPHTFGQLSRNDSKGATVAPSCGNSQPLGAAQPLGNRFRQVGASSSPVCTGRLHNAAAASPIYPASDSNHQDIINDENVAPKNRGIIDEKEKDLDGPTQPPQQQSDNPHPQRLCLGSATPTPLGSRVGLRPHHLSSSQRSLAVPLATTPARAETATGARCREASPLMSAGSGSQGIYRGLSATIGRKSSRALPSPKMGSPNTSVPRSPERGSSLARTTCAAVIRGSTPPQHACTSVRSPAVGEVEAIASFRGELARPLPPSSSQRQQPLSSRPASSTAQGGALSRPQDYGFQAMPRSFSSRSTHTICDGNGVLPSPSTVEGPLSSDRGVGVASDSVPEMWVTKWVDYSSKYGIGYTLSDGTKGVYFNDSTKITLIGGKFDYITRRDKDNPEVRTTHTFEDYPDELKKKVTLLRHFVHYMASDCADIRDGATAGESAIAYPPELEKLHSVVGGDQRSSQQTVYVRKWTRNKNAILFQLSNKIVQVIFFDKTEAILSSKARTVTYADKVGQVKNYPLSSALDSPNQELAKRLRYAREILVNLLGARNLDVA